MHTVNKCTLASVWLVCVCVCSCVCSCVCGVNNAAQGKPNKQTAKQTVEPKSMQRFCFACCSATAASTLSVLLSLSLSLFLSSPPSPPLLCSTAAPRFAFKQKPLKTLYYRILELFKYFPHPTFPPLYASFCSSPSASSLADITTRQLLQFYFLCAFSFFPLQSVHSCDNNKTIKILKYLRQAVGKNATKQ